jgi:hypothetical protein
VKIFTTDTVFVAIINKLLGKDVANQIADEK